MSDPLSVTASIITLVGTGFTIAKGLHQLADAIGSAGQETRIYADEIDSFSKLLETIRQEIITRPQNVSSKAERLFEDIVDICGRVLDPMNRLQANLNPLLVRFKDSPKKMISFGLRIQWYFSAKDKLLFYRGALRGQHRLLDTTLATLTYLAARDKNSEVIYIQQISIENSMAGIKSALDQPKVLRLSGDARTHSHSFLTSNGSTTPASTASSTSGNWSQNVSVTEIPEPGFAPGDSQLLALSRLHLNGSNEEIDDEGARVVDQLIEKEINQPFEDTAEGLWEETRVVSRKMLQYASDTLQQKPVETPASEQIHRTPQQKDSHIPVAAFQQHPFPMPLPVPNVGYDLSPRPPQWPEQDPIPTPEQPPGVWHQQQSARPQAISLQQPNPTPLPVPNASYDTSPRPPEPQYPQYAQDPNGWVTVEIPGGRKHQLPYKTVREWDSLKTTLKTLQYPHIKDRSTNRPRYLERTINYNTSPAQIIDLGLVDNDEFDVVDFQGQSIPPMLWTQRVGPGSFLQVRFRENITWTGGGAPPKSGLHRFGFGGVEKVADNLQDGMNKIFGKASVSI